MGFHDKRMLWEAFCLAFYGFLRSAEFVALLLPRQTPLSQA